MQVIKKLKKYFINTLIIKQCAFLGFLMIISTPNIFGGKCIHAKLVSEISTNGFFPLISKHSTSIILYDTNEYKGVVRTIKNFQNDVYKVTDKNLKLSDVHNNEQIVVIIGSLEKNKFIQSLIVSGKLDVKQLNGKRESFIIATIDNPTKEIKKALVIAGSDKRGTIYGIYELSEHIGVSPWHYWADVPPNKKNEIYIKGGLYFSGEPKVKYRGIFINDEAPALTGWVQETFGGFNHNFYEKVFELILRNKGNYLWPAMWPPRAFSADDPLNPKLADELGIVISTSHHEPMMRAHAEWKQFNGGAWNYTTNKAKLKEFWRGGIQRMGDYESVVTVGMRGDGDEAMSEDTGVDLLKSIIHDQRNIIEEVTQKPAEETPQVWAVYKEVQDYYDKGMRVDDDIMILFCDDNWGNIRILPKKEDLDHAGGYGIYYHFDFVGGPVSYRWLNVTQIERVWEQMKLAYSWGVEDLWLVNVGDIKPMELPISFFLDLAWDPDAIGADQLPDYYFNWAAQQFGGKFTAEIAEILSLYTKYNARRTPEMLKHDTYSLDNYREAETIVSDYKRLNKRANEIYKQLPEQYKSAFYQLVLSPVEFCCNLNEMYVALGKNKKFADQGRSSTNFYADKVKELFVNDSLLTEYYHNELNGGKWNHIMAQTHIGYTSWNNPPRNIMPSVKYITNKKDASIGYSIENVGVYAKSFENFDSINDQTYYLELFNKGLTKLNYEIKSDDWIKVSNSKGEIKYEEKIYISVDWEKLPEGKSVGTIELSSPDEHYEIKVPVYKVVNKVSGFIENNRVISIEAESYDNAVEAEGVSWTVVPNLGRTNSAVIAEPMNMERQNLQDSNSYLEYDFTLLEAGEIEVESYLSPTLNYHKTEGLKFAVSIDDENPIVVNMHKDAVQPDWEYPNWWNKSVTDHIKIMKTKHGELSAGEHKLRIWLMDPGIVFQKFVLNAGGLKPSYLGPPESNYIKTNDK